MRNWAAWARRASFRGIAFYVDGDSPERGRRVVVHDISGGEAAVTEDMGRLNPRFSVDAYIASDLADIEGMALEWACEAPGPGLLTLPFDLPVMVHCESCVRDRVKDRAGYFGYRLEFVEASSGSAGLASILGAMRTVFGAGKGGAASALARLF